MPAAELPEHILDVLGDLAKQLSEGRTTDEVRPILERLEKLRANERGISPVKGGPVSVTGRGEISVSGVAAHAVVLDIIAESTYAPGVHALGDLAASFPWAAAKVAELQSAFTSLAPEVKGALVSLAIERLHEMLERLVNGL